MFQLLENCNEFAEAPIEASLDGLHLQVEKISNLADGRIIYFGVAKQQ
jgi:hypothetical protein